MKEHTEWNHGMVEIVAEGSSHKNSLVVVSMTSSGLHVVNVGQKLSSIRS